MYKNKYTITSIVRATQTVTLMPDEGSPTTGSLEYGSIDEIIENEEYQIYDATNKKQVGKVDGGISDEDVYEEIHLQITAYESGEQQ